MMALKYKRALLQIVKFLLFNIWVSLAITVIFLIWGFLDNLNPKTSIYDTSSSPFQFLGNILFLIYGINLGVHVNKFLKKVSIQKRLLLYCLSLAPWYALGRTGILGPELMRDSVLLVAVSCFVIASFGSIGVALWNFLRLRILFLRIRKDITKVSLAKFNNHTSLKDNIVKHKIDYIIGLPVCAYITYVLWDDVNGPYYAIGVGIVCFLFIPLINVATEQRYFGFIKPLYHAFKRLSKKELKKTENKQPNK